MKVGNFQVGSAIIKWCYDVISGLPQFTMEGKTRIFNRTLLLYVRFYTLPSSSTDRHAPTDIRLCFFNLKFFTVHRACGLCSYDFGWWSHAISFFFILISLLLLLWCHNISQRNPVYYFLKSHFQDMCYHV